MTTTQSVVVPVEPTEAMLSAAKPWPKHWPKYEDASESARVAFNVDRAVVKSQWRDMLAAAPAPSSLAGGEVLVTASVIAACKGEQEHFEAWAKAKRYEMSEHPLHYIFNDPKTDAARMGWNAALAYVRDAALSPEAPAREGAVARVTDRKDLTDALTPGHPDAYLNALLDYTSGFYGAAREAGMPASSVADAMNHVERAARGLHALALTPRHEAPAEGAGERDTAADALRELRGLFDANGNLFCSGDHQLEVIARADAALRARSSAPEASEVEAVAWRWRHPHFYNNAWQPGRMHDTAGGECQPLYTHPAAPSADKLREFGQHTNLELSYRHGEEGDDGSWQVHRVNGGVNDREWTLIGSGATPSEAIDQALVALKAEGA